MQEMRQKQNENKTIRNQLSFHALQTQPVLHITPAQRDCANECQYDCLFSVILMPELSTPPN